MEKLYDDDEDDIMHFVVELTIATVLGESGIRTPSVTPIDLSTWKASVYIDRYLLSLNIWSLFGDYTSYQAIPAPRKMASRDINSICKMTSLCR